MIEVLAKVPKTLLPKVRLVGLVMSNDTEPKDCKGIPAKTPSPNRAVRLSAVAICLFLATGVLALLRGMQMA